jgi:histidinol dehydrogenase
MNGENLLPRKTVKEILTAAGPSPLPDVRKIVEHVRTGGDPAVAQIAERFGDPIFRAVDLEELRQAYRSIDDPLRAAIDGAAKRIRTFACAQRAALKDLSLEVEGGRIGHRFLPITRVGAYVPAGRRPLLSSLLMCAVPARAAGVSEIAVCSPTTAPEVLAAAHSAGVDEYYVVGGPQAIAALAFGTATIPKVDMIVGPGNAYVTAAKRLVYGTCGIDALAGPSEILIIAAPDADAKLVAADLLAQAEHDLTARALLLTDSPGFADAVEEELSSQLNELPEPETARTALSSQGSGTVIGLKSAIKLANRLAPEHLHLHGERAEALAARATAYGELFVGSNAAEALGDYGVGPNHVLPTNGSARFSSGLSVLTFLTLRTFQKMDGPPARALIEETARLAEVEGLPAHRNATLLRCAG